MRRRDWLLLLLVLGTLQLHTVANGKDRKKEKLKLTPPGQKAEQTIDPGSATPLLYEDPRNKNSVTANADKKDAVITVTGTCTDNMGMIYKKGDAGYEGCVRTYSKAAPNLPGDNKRPNSLGFTIGK